MRLCCLLSCQRKRYDIRKPDHHHLPHRLAKYYRRRRRSLVGLRQGLCCRGADRRQQSPLSIPLRCDAPELRRHLELTVVPEADGNLTIRSCTLRTEPREPVPLLDAQSERSNEFITICSWCKKVEVEGEWCEVEEAVDRLGLLVEVPHLTHGMCLPCRDAFQLYL